MLRLEVVSAMGPRRSRVTPSQGAFRLAYSGHGLAGELHLLDEADAHRAARAWERAGIVPRGPETRPDWPAVTCEQIAAYERAAARLEACR